MLSFIVALAIATHPVEFSYKSATAKHVQIAGDFNAWSAPYGMSRTGDKWSKTFDLPDTGRIEYKLVVDGNWLLDPANPNRGSNGLGGENSVWQGSQHRSSVYDDPPKNPLSRSEITVGGRKIVLFSPEQPAGLPVFIYGDGPMYESAGKIQNIVKNLVEAHKLRPVVIALVPPLDRMKEYGPEWRAYGRYVFDEVLPAVRAATHASDRAEDVFMGGSSLGGLISLRLAEEFPDKLAGGIQCQSPAIQWTALHLNNEEAATPEALNKIAPTTRIWLDWGDFEEALTKANVAMATTLRSIHRPFGHRTSPEGHTWTAWRNRMESGLTYLLGAGIIR